MDNSFFAYLERLQFLAFFSAYPLVYALVQVFSTSIKWKPAKRLPSLLPYAYALTGLLYLGLQLKNLYPDYSFENIRSTFQQSVLTIWALLAILFFIPAFAKKPVISLLHSFVFFFFLLKDLFSQLFSGADKSILRNDMKVYTDSMLVNLGAFTFIVLLSFLLIRNKKSV